MTLRTTILAPIAATSILAALAFAQVREFRDWLAVRDNLRNCSAYGFDTQIGAEIFLRLTQSFVAILLALIACGEARAQASTGCDLPKADRIIYGIALGNEESAIRVLGRDFRTVSEPPASDMAWTIFASRDNKQLLELRHHAGDVQFSFMEAEVKFGRHDRKPMKLPVFEFISGGGIKLGLKRKAVVARFGACFKSVMKGGNEIIRYEIEQKKGAPAHPLLKAANMPQYYSEYEFRSGTLIRLRFGYGPV